MIILLNIIVNGILLMNIKQKFDGRQGISDGPPHSLNWSMGQATVKQGLKVNNLFLSSKYEMIGNTPFF